MAIMSNLLDGCIRFRMTVVLVVLSGLAAFSLSAAPKWTYENGVLTEIQSERSGDTLWAFNLSADGTLSKKTYGNGSELDFRAAALPEGAPAVKVFANNQVFFSAFQTGNSTVTDFYMGEALTSIPNQGLMNMKALTNLVWSPALTSIGTHVCKNDNLMRSPIVIPEGVKIISEQAFNGCSSVPSVVLHDGVTHIYSQAFYGCSGLTSISPALPKGLTYLGVSAFYNCSSLASPIEIGFGTNDLHEAIAFSWGTNGGSLDYSWAFFGCTSLPSLRTGPGVSSMPWNITRASLKVGFVEIGPNVSTIWETFGSYGKMALTNVVIRYPGTFVFPSEYGNRNTSVSPATFNGLTDIREITWGGFFSYSASSTFNPFKGWNARQARFIVPGDNLDWMAFCADTTKLTPWASVDAALKDEYFARYGQDAKTPAGLTVAVANGLPETWIVKTEAKVSGYPLSVAAPAAAFGTVTCSPAAPASGLYEEGTVVTVTFTPASGVTFVRWTGSVDESVAGNLSVSVTMDGAKSLTPVFQSSFWYYADGELTDGTWVLGASGASDAITVLSLKAQGADGKLDLSRPVRPEGVVVSIGARAFEAQNVLVEVKLPETLQSISSYAFYQCGALTKVEPFFSDALTNLGYAAFAQANALGGFMRLGFGTNAVTLTSADKCFNGNTSLGRTLVFGPQVTVIPSEFAANTSFTNVVIGANVTSIGDSAFGAVGGTSALGYTYADVRFQGDRPSMTAPVAYGEKKRYHIRYNFSCAGHPRWRDYVTNDAKVVRWRELSPEVQAEYWQGFPESAGNRRPYGLTRIASDGLLADQWIVTDGSQGLVLLVR